MGAALQKQEEDFDEVFLNISKLYDHAENILNIAHDESIAHEEAFIEEVEALVAQIEDSANVLAQDLSEVIETGDEPTNVMKMRVSASLRKILITIDEYKSRIKLPGEQ